MWVESHKNTTKHLILLIVAIRLGHIQPALTAESQPEVAMSHLPTEMKGSETLPWVYEASYCFTIHLKLSLDSKRKKKMRFCFIVSSDLAQKCKKLEPTFCGQSPAKYRMV